MEKLWILILTLLLLMSFSAVHAETVDPEPVYLDYTTIIDGNLLYYSGSIDGGESGVFVMNADGSNPRKISDANADLLALSGSNLMVYQYDTETHDSGMAILQPDGTLIPVTDLRGGTVIAADRRFYWGAGSCADDGTDIQYYFGVDEFSAYSYYPLAVHEGFLYYLDWSEMNGKVYSEGSLYPMGAALCRMNLADQTTELISDLGTSYLGIENNTIYYTRDNFWTFADDGGEVEVDEGLFCAPLDTLTEVRLASYPESEDAFAFYSFLEDGVIYGMLSDYSASETGLCEIIRLQADGTPLDPIPLDPEAWTSINCVEDGVIYGCHTLILSSEDDFVQQDSVISINPADGSITLLNPDSLDMISYSEADPAIAVSGGRIYFCSYDMERWSLSLKSMNLDGSDLRLLAHGISYAEG